MHNIEKIEYLKKFTNNEKIISEIINYTENKFLNKDNNQSDENNYLDYWQAYKIESETIGVINTLKKYFFQLLFPVEKGISDSQSYKNATLKGQLPIENFNIGFIEPDKIFLDIYLSRLGFKTPVIIVHNEQDFNHLINVFCYKNEPTEIPESMGAIFINGINNWQRINDIKTEYLKSNNLISWAEYFKNDIVIKPHLFKDKLIILSAKPYSGITNRLLGITESSWIKSSIEIRREHECAHLFTLANYHHMANNMHDEIIADYVGISKVLGNFDKKWFYYFIGIEHYPNYRKKSRLENYVPKNFNDESFNLLMTIVKKAAEALELFDLSLGPRKNNYDWVCRIKTICEIDLLTLSSDKGVSRLFERYNKKINENLA